MDKKGLTNVMKAVIILVCVTLIIGVFQIIAYYPQSTQNYDDLDSSIEIRDSTTRRNMKFNDATNRKIKNASLRASERIGRDINTGMYVSDEWEYDPLFTHWNVRIGWSLVNNALIFSNDDHTVLEIFTRDKDLTPLIIFAEELEEEGFRTYIERGD
jgi:hypothetical protein